MPRRTYEDRNCKICGDVYAPTGPRQKRCPKCIASGKKVEEKHDANKAGKASDDKKKGFYVQLHSDKKRRFIDAYNKAKNDGLVSNPEEFVMTLLDQHERVQDGTDVDIVGENLIIKKHHDDLSESVKRFLEALRSMEKTAEDSHLIKMACENRIAPQKPKDEIATDLLFERYGDKIIERVLDEVKKVILGGLSKE